MNRPVRFWLIAFSFFAAFHLALPVARAAGKDAAATKLADDAINNDYLATKFADAEKKLRKAISLCGANACEATLRARLHRDLGVVLIAGLNRADDGKAEFAEAIKTDPNIALVKDFASPEIEQAWEAAKGGGEATATETPAQPEAPEEAAPAAASAPSGGDLVHTPAAEQATLTPVPVYVEVPSGMNVGRVVVRYKPFGVSEWKSIDARKGTKGYGAEIPCADVGSTTGDLSYYIQVLDPAGEPVGASGSRAQPFKVPIKNQLDGEPPHLPGRPPSARCADAADCPPGFPGCKRKVGTKEAGAGCESDAECGEGLNCKNNLCEVSSDAPMQSCESDTDCEGGGKCVDHWCEAKRVGAKKNWFSVGFQMDITAVPDIPHVCSPENTKGSITCLARDGGDYVGIPSTDPADGGNGIKSGLAFSTMRLLVGYDRLLGTNWMIGLRAGYAFPSAPRKSMPLHLEGRASYWFGNQPFSRTVLRPFVGLITGIAEIDTKVKVPIVETIAGADNPNYGPPNGLFIDENGGQTLTVWRRARTGFFGGTFGAMMPLGSPNSGLQLEVKVFFSFPDSGTTLSPVLSYVVGF